MKGRVLFVDDEPKVLQGLQRSLRKMRREMDMAFAGSGPEALEILRREVFDVIVTDMRMPGMDGAQLLQEVRKIYPNSIRFILSGQSDRKSILNTVGLAHQFLSKPCEADTIIAAVRKACDLQSFLGEESIKRVISQIDVLPSPPTLYQDIMIELESPRASINKVSEIISRDIGMSTQILKLVNSAFFGLTQQVRSITHAVNLLGLETVTALALSLQMFRQFAENAKIKTFSEHLLGHSFRVGILARAISRTQDGGRLPADEAFLSGLLHDTGKLILADNFSSRYEKVIAESAETGQPLCEMERQEFQTTHAEIGAYLIGLWGLPTSIVETLAYHHKPRLSNERAFSNLTAVHVSNGLLRADAESAADPSVYFDYEYIQTLGLEDRVPEWQNAYNIYS